jgi:probable phosphoglycerate mutase
VRGAGLPGLLLLLARHAAHDRVDRVLCGRMPGVHLGAAGRAQAARLAERVAREGRPVAALHTSPQPRAAETAEAIARRCGLAATPCAALDEIDFGPAWTGRDFASLAGDPAWRRWNAGRASAAPPAGGESMAAVQRRVMAWMAELPGRHPAGGVVVAVSHGDVIKAAVAGVLGLTLDAHWRFEVGPAALSAVALEPGGGAGRLLLLNEAPPAEERSTGP